MRRALADVLLQFRARTDEADGGALRIDKVGPALVAEQRIVLGGARLGQNEAGMLEYALLREVIASHPLSSVNGVFEARNAISKMFMDGGGSAGGKKHAMAYLQHEVPVGGTCSPYDAIHHNFSRDTPKNIAAFIGQWVFTAGPLEERGALFGHLTSALKLARDGDGAGARALIDGVHDGHGDATLAKVRADLGKVNGDDDAKIGDAIVAFLQKSAAKPLGPHAEANLMHAATVYRCVCADQPGAAALEQKLFKAGDAWPAVANAIVALRGSDQLAQLRTLGNARLAMRDAICASQHGYERHEMITMDAQLNRALCETLGASVERVGAMKTDADKAEALLGVQAALRGALASGLHAIRAPDDDAPRGRGLAAVLKDVDAALARGSIEPAAFRALMQQTRLEVTRAVQNIRAFVDTRAAAIARGSDKTDGISLDPEFLDQFIKQGPLHYATAIADAGMSAGLEEKIGARSIANIEGMRVLNTVGPVVFPSVVCAENTHDLLALKPARDGQIVMAYDTTAAEFFQAQLPALLRAAPLNDGVVRFEIGGADGGVWLVDLANRSVQPAAPESAASAPTVLVRANARDFMPLVEGRMSASDGVLTERLHVAGDVVRVGELLDLLSRLSAR